MTACRYFFEQLKLPNSDLIASGAKEEEGSGSRSVANYNGTK
jgi:hypothetical protein